jgi:hypothetical protein
MDHETPHGAEKENTDTLVKVTELPGGAKSTSYIPIKGHLQEARPMKSSLSNLNIEVIHVIIFLILLFCTFIKAWKTSQR